MNDDLPIETISHIRHSLNIGLKRNIIMKAYRIDRKTLDAIEKYNYKINLKGEQ